MVRFSRCVMTIMPLPKPSLLADQPALTMRLIVMTVAVSPESDRVARPCRKLSNKFHVNTCGLGLQLGQRQYAVPASLRENTTTILQAQNKCGKSAHN